MKPIISVLALVLCLGVAKSAFAEKANIKILSFFLSTEYSAEVVYEVDRSAFVECFGMDKNGKIIATGNDIAQSAKKGTVTFAIGSKTSSIKKAECQAEANEWQSLK